MRASVDSKLFFKQMNNIVDYGLGFIDGVQSGKGVLLMQLGEDITELIGEYIDSNARANPGELHHVYEWYQTGSPSGRLFDVDYRVIGNAGLSFESTFRQSSTVKNGSRVPFYNKAKIMEQGIPVTIRPNSADVLAFEDGGETVFTKGPVRIDRPGGDVAGAYEATFEEFFIRYLSQSFLDVTGLARLFKNPITFKMNFAAGARGGRPVGVRAGQSWMASKGAVI